MPPGRPVSNFWLKSCLLPSVIYNLFTLLVIQITTKTGRLQIQRQMQQLTLVPNANDFGHVALFIIPKRSMHVISNPECLSAMVFSVNGKGRTFGRRKSTEIQL